MASRPFVCVYSVSKGAKASQASFTKDIPEDAMQRCGVLQQAASVEEGEEAKLVLPHRAQKDFLDSWLQLPDLVPPANTREISDVSMEFIVKILQAADFLADEFAIRYACVELSDRMFKTKFGSTEGAPVSNKWKSGEDRAGKASREYTQIQERKDANEKIVQQLSSNICLKLFSQENLEVLDCIRYLHAPQHALVLEAQHPSVVFEACLELEDQRGGEMESRQEISDGLTAAATFTQLTSLSLSDCWLSDCNHIIQDSLLVLLTSLPLLQCLEIASGFNAAAAETIGAAVSHTSVTALRTLVLMASSHDGYGTVTDERDDTSLIQKLRHLPELHNLSCTGLQEECDDIEGFCKGLQQLPGLTALTLAECFASRGDIAFGGGGTLVTGHVAGALRKLTQLKELSLEKSFPSEVPNDCIEPVLDAIACLTSLTSLSLAEIEYRVAYDWMNEDFMSEDVPDTLVFGHRLAPMLCNLHNLQYLNLNKCHISEDVAESVVDGIGSLTCLSGLHLAEVTEEELFWEMFAMKVSGLIELRALCVSRNDSITNLNIGELAMGLAELPNLQWLQMNQCEIERDGVIEFSKQLSQMTALADLSLLTNRISPQGAKALAANLKGLTNLDRLALCKGDIGSEGETVIVDALENCFGSRGQQILQITLDFDEWDSDHNEGEEDLWEDMEVGEIAQLLAAADNAENLADNEEDDVSDEDA